MERYDIDCHACMIVPYEDGEFVKLNDVNNLKFECDTLEAVNACLKKDKSDLLDELGTLQKEYDEVKALLDNITQ